MRSDSSHKRQLELVRGHRLEVVGAIEIRRAVDAGCAAAGEQLEVRVALDVLRSLKHHVLEQVREARAAGRLVRRPDVIPDVDADERHTVIFRQDHLEPVRAACTSRRRASGCRPTAPARQVSARMRTPTDSSANVFCMTFYFLLFTFYFLLSTFGLFSRLAHRYHDATDRYGRHRSAIVCNAFDVGRLSKVVGSSEPPSQYQDRRPERHRDASAGKSGASRPSSGQFP